MKKLITFLGLGALCVSSAAALNPDLANLKFQPTEQTLQLLESAAVKETIQSSNDNKRVIMKANEAGNWYVELQLLGPATDYVRFGDGSVDYTIEDIPFYCASVAFWSATNGVPNEKSAYQAYMFWPTRYAYDQQLTWPGPWEEFTAENGQTYEDIPLESRDYTPTPFSLLANNTNDYGQGIVLPKIFRYTGRTITYENNVPVCYGLLIVGGFQTVGTSQVSLSNTDFNPDLFYQINAYSLDDDYLQCAAKWKFTREDNNQTVDFNVNFDGTADYVARFEAKDVKFEPETVHMFNAGIYDPEELGDENDFYNYNYGDNVQPNLAQYFLFVTGTNVTVDLAQGVTNPAFNPDNLQLYLTKEAEEAGVTEADVTFIRGYFWLPLETGAPFDENGLRCDLRPYYTEKYTDEYGQEVVDEYYDEPRANMFLPGYFRTVGEGRPEPVLWSEKWGMQYVMRGKYDSPAKDTYFVAGSKEGFLFKGVSTDGNNLSVAPFTGKVIYHNDPNDIKVYTEIDAVGKMDNNSAVSEISAANNGITAIFDLNGRRVNGQLEKGLYIKVVDGKASKILVK